MDEKKLEKILDNYKERFFAAWQELAGGDYNERIYNLRAEAISAILKLVDEEKSQNAMQRRIELQIEQIESLESQLAELKQVSEEMASAIEKWIPSMKSAIRCLEEEGFNRATIEPKKRQVEQFETLITNYKKLRSA